MNLNNDIIITGKRAIAKSYAKINLTLDVLGKRSNGYHDVLMVMQTLNLFDLILIDKISEGIFISTNLKYLPTNEKNIAYKAADLFFKTAKISGGAKILIHKNIPVAAGLAGGSGNAAAVLCSLNKLYDYPLTYNQLFEIGANIGADVPYCIMGGTALSSGIGEILTPLTDMPKTSVLLVKPPINVSTALIYEKIDNVKLQNRPNTDAMIEHIKNRDIYGICSELCNVMENVTVQMHPVIKGIKEKLLLNGACGAIMSGSGPTVFGIFDDEKKAKSSCDSFSKFYKDVYLCSTLN